MTCFLQIALRTTFTSGFLQQPETCWSSNSDWNTKEKKKTMLLLLFFMHKRPRADFQYHNYVRVLCVFVRHTAGEHNKTPRSTPPQPKIQLTFWRTRWESRWRCLDSLSAEMSIATSVRWRCESAVDSLLPRAFRVHPVCVCVFYAIFSMI